MTEQIYVALLDEGVDVWQPVSAEKNPDGSYRILQPRDYDAKLEHWQYPPGSVVICQQRTTRDGTILAATKLRDNVSQSNSARRVG